jgi:predicted heme/steroid binding protein
MKVFTVEELKKYDGSNGIAYFACGGKVYDVSRSYHWRKGVHHARHYAGRDLTGSLKQAPHSLDLLSKFPTVGKLVESGPVQH